jgi:hypothetical protein
MVATSNTILSSNIDVVNQGNLKNNGNFHIKKDLINNASIVSDSGKFTFSSPNSAQVISGSNTIQFYNLEISNGFSGNALTLNKDAMISNRLDFKDGIIVTDATNLLNFMDESNAFTAKDSSHIKGPVRKIGNDGFIFPVGSGSSYNPCQISAPSSITDHFTAQYFETNPHPLYSRNLKDITLDHISLLEYWTIDRTNGSSNVSVTLHWDTISQVNVFNDLRVARWDGTQSKDHGNSLTSGTVNDGYITTGAPVNSFSPFTLASISVDNPLPIELIYFDAEKEDKSVYLTWTTVSEINNDLFIVERSENGYNNWEEVLRRNGAGNSSSTLNYSGYDYSPIKGDSYYRLKQVDYNGNYEYSSIRYIYFNEDYNNSEIKIYPNPAKDIINIFYKDVTSNSSITLYDNIGKQLIQSQITSKQMSLDVSALANGVYTVQIRNENQTTSTTKLIITH